MGLIAHEPPSESTPTQDLIHSLNEQIRTLRAQLAQYQNTDCARRERVEQQLGESEARFSQVIDLVPHMIYARDRHGRFVLCNRAAALVYGMDLEQLLGQHYSEVHIDQAQVQKSLEDDQEVLRTGQPKRIDRQLHRRPDGSDRVLQVYKTPFLVKDASELAVLSVAVDVTDKEEAIAQLRQSEELFSLFMDQIPAAVFIKDAEGCYQYVNQYMRTSFGADSWIGQRTPDSVLIGPQAAESAAASDRIVLEQGPAVFAQEVQTLDGETRHFEARKFAINRPHQPPLVGGISWDVSEVKKAAKERASLEEQLFHSQKMEAVGRLAGGVAHDLNNLLLPILGYAEIGLIKLQAQDTGYAEIQHIREAAERAKDLTRQLLAFGRKQVLNMKVIELNQVIHSFQHLLKRMIREDIDTRVVLAPSLGSIKADPTQLEQIIMNLAVNAQDAMPDGGRLIIETDNVYLDEEYARSHANVNPGPHVMLALSDTGTGMSSETLSHVFEPFFTTKERGKGTGLGLATVYGIIKQHGANIWVYSEVGRGTVFKIYFPRVDPAPATATLRSPFPGAYKGTETVLLVEDEQMVRQLVTQVLQLNGYTVLTAKNPEEARAYALEHPTPIDLVLTDVILPGINGRLLFDQLHEHRPNLKVLYMSGYTSSVVAQHGILNEQAHFLQKPFSTQALAQKVRQALDSEPVIVPEDDELVD